jgi:hypothetical protein
LLGDCCGNHGTTKRKIVICKKCLSKYHKAAGFVVAGLVSRTGKAQNEQHLLSIVKSVARSLLELPNATEEQVAATAAASQEWTSLTERQLRQMMWTRTKRS